MSCEDLATLLGTLRARRGVTIAQRDGRVVVEGWRSLSTLERDTLRRHRAEVLALLESERVNPPVISKAESEPGLPAEDAVPAPVRKPAVERDYDPRAREPWRRVRSPRRQRAIFAQYLAQSLERGSGWSSGAHSIPTTPTAPTESRWTTPLDRRFR